MSEEITAHTLPPLDSNQWSSVLVQALPYFRHWVGKTVVVKYGGNAMLNEELKRYVMEDIVLLNTIGVKVVLVHGGGPEINAMLEKVGKESKFINGLRYTDAETMEIVQMVLAGKLNKGIVGMLVQQGGKAVGLSGTDGGLIRAKKLDKGDGVDYGFVG
ncbi:MAG: acetylglutamate kinase, partial [Treponema sp.]|nr:acetylglutamate kinase [Treponema sp.]